MAKSEESGRVQMTPEQEATITAFSGQPEPDSDDGAESNDEPKLLAGKFKTVEELESSYKELEKFERKNAERISKLETQYEEYYAAPEEPVAEPTQEQTTPVESKTDFLAKFYADPETVLSQVRDKAKQEARAEAQAALNAERTLNKFFGANTDLTPHEELLNFAFQKTPANLPVPERLDRAGQRVREMLALNAPKAKGKVTQPKADDFVEAPDDADNSTAQQTVVTRSTTAEEDFSEYMAMRKKDAARGARPPQARPKQK